MFRPITQPDCSLRSCSCSNVWGRRTHKNIYFGIQVCESTHFFLTMFAQVQCSVPLNWTLKFFPLQYGSLGVVKASITLCVKTTIKNTRSVRLFNQVIEPQRSTWTALRLSEWVLHFTRLNFFDWFLGSSIVQVLSHWRTKSLVGGVRADPAPSTYSRWRWTKCPGGAENPFSTNRKVSFWVCRETVLTVRHTLTKNILVQSLIKMVPSWKQKVFPVWTMMISGHSLVKRRRIVQQERTQWIKDKTEQKLTGDWCETPSCYYFLLLLCIVQCPPLVTYPWLQWFCSKHKLAGSLPGTKV